MSEKEFFKGKTVVITGASSGIGRALAYEFAANGANVVIGARHDTKLAGIAGDLTNRGPQWPGVPPMSPARRIAAAW